MQPRSTQVTQGASVGDDELLELSTLLADELGAQPLGVALGQPLLPEPVALDAVGEAVHRDDAAPHVGQHERRDAFVVVGQIGLREAIAREHELVGVMHGERAAARWGR
jgi:hypothetical protein